MSSGSPPAAKRARGGGGEARPGRLLFLGSGASSGTPILRDLLQPENCATGVCARAQADPASRDRRGPPSLLVQRAGSSGAWRTLLIDCGPGFKPAAARLLPPLGVVGLDAVLLTHGHADAVVGLNDLREVQAAGCAPGEWDVRTDLPLYADARTLGEARRMYPFLFPKEGAAVATLVGRLAPSEVDHSAPFGVAGFDGMPVEPLPVEHGRGYISLGFGFGEGEDGRVAYISDMSVLPPAALAALRARPVAVLILDAISWDRARPSHMSVLQALDVVRQVAPRRALLVGMSCALPHEETQRRLDAEREAGRLPCSVELAWDGLIVDIAL